MNKAPFFITVLCVAVVTSIISAVSAEEPAGPASAPTKPPGKSEASADAGSPAATRQNKSLTEINKEMNNPVSDLWYLTVQYNHIWSEGKLADGTKDADIMVFQPVLPLKLTKEWNLINRPTASFVLGEAAPSGFLDEDGTTKLDFDHVGGMGDTVILSLLAPSAARSFLWGFGPILTLPTASDKRLGAGKWSAGPAGFLGYIGDRGFIGLLAQQQWSYAGWADEHVSLTDLQYFVQLFLPGEWQVGLGNPDVLIDWTVDDDDKVTFPVGLNVAKMIKVGETPVKLWLSGYYTPVRPDSFGEEWAVRFQISPTIPSLIKGYLFE